MAIRVIFALMLALSPFQMPAQTRPAGAKGGGPSAPVKADGKATRISFDVEDSSNATYKQHISDLWEKTKPIVRQDAAKNLTDEEYLRLGREVKAAWVNLQVHGSMKHKEKRESSVEDTKDNKLGNMVASIIGLTDELYGWPANARDKREESRTRLRNGRLESKIKEFEGILKSVDVN